MNFGMSKARIGFQDEGERCEAITSLSVMLWNHAWVVVVCMRKPWESPHLLTWFCLKSRFNTSLLGIWVLFKSNIRLVLPDWFFHQGYLIAAISVLFAVSDVRRLEWSSTGARRISGESENLKDYGVFEDLLKQPSPKIFFIETSIGEVCMNSRCR